MKHQLKIILFAAVIAVIVAAIFLFKFTDRNYPRGESMLSSIQRQLDFGARNVGSIGRVKTQEYIKNQLQVSGIASIEQQWRDETGQNLKNIIGRINPTSSRRVLIVTHYDTIEKAELDKKNKNATMPGANDGASGVAMLLELGKSLNINNIDKNIGIDLVFLDAEEFNPGDYKNWKPKGSSYFVENIDSIYSDKKPELAINVDMVCDADLQIYKDPSSLKSAPEAVQKIWEEAKKIGSSSFKDKQKLEIKDDISPFIDSGIPGVLIIDFDYPYFHTSKDKINNCSSKSLETVHDTIKNYLQNYR